MASMQHSTFDTRAWASLGAFISGSPMASHWHLAAHESVAKTWPLSRCQVFEWGCLLATTLQRAALDGFPSRATPDLTVAYLCPYCYFHVNRPLVKVCAQGSGGASSKFRIVAPRGKHTAALVHSRAVFINVYRAIPPTIPASSTTPFVNRVITCVLIIAAVVQSVITASSASTHVAEAGNAYCQGPTAPADSKQ
ncbi:hypothetical protein BOTBODRAFT_533546 [Botryobasidium botryosum FD-172 SS1]|uniref:Uncharacterized protein n=1 Tax=Botryobasidium botryosum (strain FD-172 SS1) TaxID=930990 RepID=A0A067MBB8_BOTB1|nr:hypothetical protein BOTBODRAFT_533546 [Botryobasidium botryosum FD-172 SS1]